MSEKASCGYAGTGVKSDCRITYESGNAELQITFIGTESEGKVEEAVRKTAERLGVSRGKAEIENQGAAPFVASARFEAAVRKVLGNEFPGLPSAPDIEPSGRNIPRRSRLYVPGNRPRFMEKALSSGADGVILDLEDSVSPERKFEARILVAHVLSNLGFGDMEVMVRINQGETAVDDIEWIVPQRVQHILIPKVETPDQVSTVKGLVRKVSESCGRKAAVWLMPIIESPLGVFNALDIARSAPEVTAAITLGLQDLSAEMGVTPTVEGTESFTARSLLVLAARAAGLQPIDTVYADVKNKEGLRESVKRAKALGFVGKGCIHPAQVPVINEGFMPGEAELDMARRIVTVMEQATASGLGAVTLGSKMIDPPVAKQAQVVVENAIRLGLISVNWKEERKK